MKVIYLFKEMIYLQVTESIQRVKEVMETFSHVLVLALTQYGGINQYFFLIPKVEIQMDIMQLERQYFRNFVWLVR